MKLEGSCHCGGVSYSMNSKTPYPYMRCYCSICRKTGGGGGYAINLAADAESLQINGGEHLGVYSAVIDGKDSLAQRSFCSKCATALWVYDPQWPELVHPFASSIDTVLPVPPQTVHIMLASKPDWVVADIAEGDLQFDGYPKDSIEQWHVRHGLLEVTASDD